MCGVFALPARAIGDIVDRRKLIRYAETWMVVALVLAVLTIAGFCRVYIPAVAPDSDLRAVCG